MVTAEPGVRRAHEGIEIPALTAEPRKAEQRDERGAERGLRDAHLGLDAVRDAERAKRRLERSAPAVDRRTDDGDLLRGGAVPEQVEDLVADQLEQPTGARRLEKPQCPLERRGSRPLVDVELSLEIRELRPSKAVGRRRQFLDPPLGDPREIRRGSLERVECDAPGLVGERDRHVHARGQRLDQRPLRARQVLEAVRIHGRAVPGAEIPRSAIGPVTPLAVAVADTEPIELVAVRGVERAQVAFDLVGLDETGLELAQRGRERLGEAREPGGAAERRPDASGELPDEERSLRVREHCAAVAVSSREAGEDAVERVDRSRQQRSALGEQFALHAVDVPAVRDDQHGIAREIRAETRQEQSDFSRVRRTREQRQRHTIQCRAGGPRSRPARSRL